MRTYDTDAEQAAYDAGRIDAATEIVDSDDPIETAESMIPDEG